VLVAVNATRSSTSSVGSGAGRERLQVPVTDDVATGDHQQQQQQQQQHGDDEGDSAAASVVVVEDGRPSSSLSRSSRHSSDDAASRLSGDDRSRASYSVRFAAVSERSPQQQQ